MVFVIHCVYSFRNDLRQLLASVVKSVQCCVEEYYLDGLGYF